MADSQALGAAFETLGSGVASTVNNYFQSQIGAAQKAQEMTLKQMQLKSQEDEKNQTLAETARHNQADEATSAARAKQEADYQQGLLGNDTAKTTNEAKFQQGELSDRGAEVANQEKNTASEISHRSAEEQEAEERIANEKNGGGTAALTAGEKLYTGQLADLQKQLKAANPNGVDASALSKPDQDKVNQIQQQINDKQQQLSHVRAQLSSAGKLEAPLGPDDQSQAGVSPEIQATRGVAPPQQPGAQAAGASAQGAKGMPLQPGAKTATNPQTGQKVQLVNGQWVPVNG